MKNCDWAGYPLSRRSKNHLNCTSYHLSWNFIQVSSALKFYPSVLENIKGENLQLQTLTNQHFRLYIFNKIACHKKVYWVRLPSINCVESPD